MLELFIELTNQIFWDGYAQELSTENPTVFEFRLNEFINSYGHQQPPRKQTQRVSVSRSVKKNKIVN